MRKFIAEHGWSAWLRQPNGVYDWVDRMIAVGLEPRVLLHRPVGDYGSGFMRIDAWPNASAWGNAGLLPGLVVSHRNLAQHCRLIEYVGTYDKNTAFDSFVGDPSKYDDVQRLLWNSVGFVDRVGCGLALDHTAGTWGHNHLRQIAHYWLEQGRECWLEALPVEPIVGVDPRMGAMVVEETYQQRHAGTGRSFKELREVGRIIHNNNLDRAGVMGQAQRILDDGHTVIAFANTLQRYKIELGEFSMILSPIKRSYAEVAVLPLLPDAYWPCDDADGAATLVDVRGTNNATLSGTYNLAALGGILPNAFSRGIEAIDAASGSYARALVLTGNSLNTAGGVTQAAWVNTTNGMLVGRYGLAGGFNYYAYVNGAAATVTVGHHDGTTAKQQAFAATGVGDGNWHHVAGVRQSDGRTWEAYLDGASIGSFDAVTQTPGATQYLSFLSLSNAAQKGIGKIAHNAIWLRALTAAEIKGLYLQGLNGV